MIRQRAMWQTWHIIHRAFVITIDGHSYQSSVMMPRTALAD